MLQKETYPYVYLRRFGAALLCLVLFLSGQFRFQFQHYLAHSAAYEAHHDSAAEANPCHQAVFHQGSSMACDHPTHLTATDTDCELCDCLLQVIEFRLLSINLSSTLLAYQAVFTFLPATDGNPILLAAARGPPFLL